MAGRQHFNDEKYATSGQVDISFSFLLNGTGAIATSSIRGEGILPGGSIVYASATGVYTVTLAQGEYYKYLITAKATLDDTANDGAYATIGGVTNEANGTTPIVFTLYTRAAGGTLANFTSRRCGVNIKAKNTLAGA